MRLWPKTKDRGWYGPFDLMEDFTSPIEDAASWATKDRAWADWLKGKGSDFEKSKVGGAILSASPSVGMSYGNEGLEAQAGLNRAQGGPSVTVGQGQAGQADQENQGRDWGGAFMSLLPILAQGAGSYMQYGREEKDRERMAEAQGAANLANLWAGRHIVDPQFTPSKVGGWEKLANIGGQALQAGQQQRAQAEQARVRDLQRQQLQGQLADDATARQEQQRTARENRIRQEARAGAARGELRGAGITPFGEETEPTASMGGRQPGPPVSRGRTQREVDIYDIERAGQVKSQKLYDLQVEAAQVGIDAANLDIVHKKRLAEMPDTKAVLAVASAFGSVTPGLSKEEFFSSPMVVNVGLKRPLTPEQMTAMYATYKVAAQDQKLKLAQRDRARLDIFQANMQREKTIQIRNDIRQAMTEMTTAFKVKGAQGVTDIQLLKLLARMQDPGSVVREAEYNTLAQAIPIWEQFGIVLERVAAGDKLNDKTRAAIYQLGVEAYNNRMGDINRIAEGYIASETLPHFDMDSPEHVQMFQIAANPFRLPALDEKVVQGIIGREPAVDTGNFKTDQRPDLRETERENLEDIVTKTGGRPQAGTTNILPALSGLNLQGLLAPGPGLEMWTPEEREEQAQRYWKGVKSQAAGPGYRFIKPKAY